MDKTDKRRHKRYPMYCSIEYECEDSAPIEASITVNLSEGGALISTSRPVKPQSVLIIRITLSGEAFSLRSRVIHTNCEKEGAIYTAGVEFLDIPRNFVRRFYEELETTMPYRKQ